MKKYSCPIGITVIFWSVMCHAQMTLTGELRPRTEYRHGYLAPLDSAINGATATSQRTRLNFGYSADKFKVAISLQDIRVWGSTSQLVSAYTDAPTFLHQAWGQYWIHPKFSVKAGRQELIYDDERLLGAVNWAQQARAHDAVVVTFEDDSLQLKVHAGATYNQNGLSNTRISYTVASNYKEMHFLWVNKKFGPISSSLLFFNNGSQSPVSAGSTRFFQTAGTHLEYKKSAVFGSFRFYYQTGVDAAKKDVQAWMAGADVAYTVAKKLSLGVGAEAMSGQSQADTAKAYKDINHSFNPLYGTGHKFNGYMDYYYAGSAHKNVGLMDVYIRVKYKKEKWWTALDFHKFKAGADVLNSKELAATGQYKAMNPDLGMEIDLEAGYNFSPVFSVQAGYSHYLSTETIAVLKGVTDYSGGGETRETANWGYLMLIFKPNFTAHP